MICLALLHNTIGHGGSAGIASKAVRNLSVLVVEVESGALAQREDPNHALLTGAVQTINNLLDRILKKKFTQEETVRLPISPLDVTLVADAQEDWSTFDVNRLQDFDPEFWVNLADHPFLATPNNAMEGQYYFG